MSHPPLTIATTEGAVQGVLAAGVRTWRGIPFAAPPVGPLRLRAPQPPLPWDGVRDASRFGAAPPQLPHRLGVTRRTETSEDCLTLNVSAPRGGGERLPVLVWFYGGAFTMGASSNPLYRGDRLVKRGNVVFVSLNYRLGPLGFFDFRGYGTPDRPFDANLGLRDQVAALQWVQRNIAAFGGDPGNVTIFGESAGGTSTISLMCAPSAAGLFHQAYAQSPAAGVAYGPELHAGWAKDLLGVLGVKESDANHALTELTAAKLVGAAGRLINEIGPDARPGTIAAAPLVDGDFLPKRPIDAFRDGDAHRVPLVLGTMAREGALFPRLLDLLPTSVPRIERMFAQTEPDARDRVIAAYPGYPSPERAIDIAGDMCFWQPSVLVAEAHSRRSPTWCYRFDYSQPLIRLLKLTATHGLDVPAMFGLTWSGPLAVVNVLGGGRVAAALSRRFGDGLLALARTGTPGAHWPRYDETDRRTLLLGKTDRVESDPRRDRRLAWGDFRGNL
jgi:para-nitrobenzyl esterase